MRKTSTLFFLGILAVLLAASYTGYVFWQKSSSEVEIDRLNYSVNEYKNKILKYESERVLQAISAKQTLDNLKTSNIEWSKVIKDIRNTLPKTESGSDLIDVLSYSGSTNSDISLTLKTIEASENPFIDVAKVIAAFDKSPLFTGTFVPSIGIGEGKDGGEVLSFSMTTKYMKASVADALGQDESVSDPAESLEDVTKPLAR